MVGASNAKSQHGMAMAADSDQPSIGQSRIIAEIGTKMKAAGMVSSAAPAL